MGKHLFSAQVIPNRGAWLEYETDSNEILYVKIDRQRKVFITALLRALGYGTNAEIVDLLGEEERLLTTLEKDTTHSVEDGLIEIYKRQRPGEPPTEESARSLLNALFFDKRYDLARVGRYKFNKKLSLAARISGFIAAEDVIDPATGEVLLSAGATSAGSRHAWWKTQVSMRSICRSRIKRSRCWGTGSWTPALICPLIRKMRA